MQRRTRLESPLSPSLAPGPSALRRAELALEQATDGDNASEVAQASLALGRAHAELAEQEPHSRAHPQRARVALEAGMRFARTSGDGVLLGELLVELAWVSRRQRNLDLALEEAGTAEALLAGYPQGYAAAVVRAAVLHDLGRVRVAQTVLEQVVQATDRLEAPAPAVVATARRQALAELARHSGAARAQHLWRRIAALALQEDAAAEHDVALRQWEWCARRAGDLASCADALAQRYAQALAAGTPSSELAWELVDLYAALEQPDRVRHWRHRAQLQDEPTQPVYGLCQDTAVGQASGTGALFMAVLATMVLTLGLGGAATLAAAWHWLA